MTGVSVISFDQVVVVVVVVVFFFAFLNLRFPLTPYLRLNFYQSQRCILLSVRETWILLSDRPPVRSSSNTELVVRFFSYARFPPKYPAFHSKLHYFFCCFICGPVFWCCSNHQMT